MYHVINTHIDPVLRQIVAARHVADYDFLLGNRHRVGDSEYQRRYRLFWALNAARLSETFCANYFDLLKDVLETRRDIREIARLLYLVESNKNGHKLQFSFATKLLHMADPHTPIYDALVADFFFFSESHGTEKIPERIEELADFHEFLTVEYARVLEAGLLRPSIEKFREKLKPNHFTDQKVIDSLIWGFVSLQRGGAAGRGEVVYC